MGGGGEEGLVTADEGLGQGEGGMESDLLMLDLVA